MNNTEILPHRIDYDVFTHLHYTTLLGGEFSNCYGQGKTPKESYTSLKIRVNQLRSKKIKFMESSIKETLVKAVIDNNKTDVFVECPHCKHTEQHPIDEQRHHIQTFNIVMWKPDEEDKNEVSIMECIPCKEFFELEWKYNAL